jgi:hypothetical protein
MRRACYAFVIFIVGLLLCAGDNHNCLQAASCAGCLRAPVLVQTAAVIVEIALADVGYRVVTANPQFLPRFKVSVRCQRAPPLITSLFVY